MSGKLGPIEFIGTRSTRAFAYSSRCQIAISKYFDKRTLFHECGHIMEFLDTISLTCSTQFRDNRAQGPVETLRSLTGISEYKTSEVAVPDSFIDPYVGKVYDHASSEVFSMAIENMATTPRIINFINKDPEHFKMFLGVCAHKNPELSARLRRFSESTSSKNSAIEDKQKRVDDWLEAIKKACPPFFMEALTSKEGVFNLYIDVRGNSPTSKGWLLQRDQSDPNRFIYVFQGTAASLVKGAYLFCAINHGLIQNTMGDGKPRSLRDYCEDFINGGKVPAWFDKDTPLPKLELPPDVVAKARKGSQKLFLAAIASAIPSDLFQRLQSDQGVEGFSIDSWANSKNKTITLHHRESNHDFYYGPKSILPMAYLLIMNKRNLLPEHEDSIYMANRKFMYYVIGKDVPDWFDPDMPLPELKI